VNEELEKYMAKAKNSNNSDLPAPSEARQAGEPIEK